MRHRLSWILDIGLLKILWEEKWTRFLRANTRFPWDSNWDEDGSENEMPSILSSARPWTSVIWRENAIAVVIVLRKGA